MNTRPTALRLRGVRCLWQVPPSLDEVTAHWNRPFSPLAVTMDGAVEALETLQTLGIVLGLVTNGTVRGQEQKLDVLGLRRYFSGHQGWAAAHLGHARGYQHTGSGLSEWKGP